MLVPFHCKIIPKKTPSISTSTGGMSREMNDRSCYDSIVEKAVAVALKMTYPKQQNMSKWRLMTLNLSIQMWTWCESMQILNHVITLILYIARVYQHDKLMKVTSEQVAAGEAEKNSSMVLRSLSIHGWAVPV